MMPNHIHGVIIIHQLSASQTPPVGASLVGALRDANRVSMNRAITGRATTNKAITRVVPTLGDVVGAFKSLTTVEYGRGVREMDWQPFDKRLWQRNYYERIIRNESEYARAGEYIVNNPMKWEFDLENPARTNTDTARTGKPNDHLDRSRP